MLVSDSIIELVIAIAGIVLLIYLTVALMAPGYDGDKEIAKSYFERLEGEIAVVDLGDVGEFVMFEREEGGPEFYLAYFGSVSDFEFEGKYFSSPKVGDNVLCVCYDVIEAVVCKYCIYSELPFSFNGNKSEMQVFGEGNQFEIRRRDYYEFSKV